MDVNLCNSVLGHRFNVMLYRLLYFERKRRNVAIAVDFYADIGNYALFFKAEFYALVFAVQKRNAFNLVNGKRNDRSEERRVGKECL